MIHVIQGVIAKRKLTESPMRDELAFWRSRPPFERIAAVESLRRANTMALVSKMAEAGVDAVSLDSPEVGVDLPEVARTLPSNAVIMGNVNPTARLLNGRPTDVEEDVSALLRAMRPYPNFVLSTGCDLPQETPLENIHAFMRSGRRYRS